MFTLDGKWNSVSQSVTVTSITIVCPVMLVTSWGGYKVVLSSLQPPLKHHLANSSSNRIDSNIYANESTKREPGLCIPKHSHKHQPNHVPRSLFIVMHSVARRRRKENCELVLCLKPTFWLDGQVSRRRVVLSFHTRTIRTRKDSFYATPTWVAATTAPITQPLIALVVIHPTTTTEVVRRGRQGR